ncbi:MAG: glycosyltransferase family 39 protein [Rhodospirillaceae bacterium]|nr:glycosyltransferase family 39 protein [Rhodospirillaceae bacterium]
MTRWPVALVGAAVLWLAVVASALLSRAPLPVDETRYLAAAWEMWSRGDFLVPHLNGVPYSHKPPLLFWLVHLGWVVFGVVEWWARVVAPLFSLGALILTSALARRLWPDDASAAGLAPLVLVGFGLLGVLAPMTMFDGMNMFFTSLGLLGVLRAAEGHRRSGWVLVGLAVGLGILSKGPVILVGLLPAPLLAPIWAARGQWGGPGRWYGGLGLAILGGAVLALAWAIPAAFSGGPEFRDMLLFGQTAGRALDAFAHGRAWWWYLAWLAPLLYPWAWWPGLWRAVRQAWPLRFDRGLRFCVCAVVPALLVFSLISAKQPHYLLPLFPLFALAFARLLSWNPLIDRPLARLPVALPTIVLGIAVLLAPLVAGWVAASPVWAADIPWFAGVLLAAAGVGLIVDGPRTVSVRIASIAAVTTLTLCVVNVAGFAAAGPYYDLRGIATVLADGEREGKPIAHVGDYEGQFHFLGRLRKPIEDVVATDAPAWARAHPNGLIVAYFRGNPAGLPQRPLWLQPYRGRWAAVWAAGVIGVDGDTLLVDRFP